jgi:hypothetical protein
MAAGVCLDMRWHPNSHNDEKVMDWDRDNPGGSINPPAEKGEGNDGSEFIIDKYVSAS